MPKIRILFIDSRGDLGGGSNHLASILKNLNREKFEAFVAAPAGQINSEIYRKLCEDFCHIPFRTFSLDAFRDLIGFSEQHKVHFIHSHGRGAGIYSRLLHWKTKIPVVHTFHGISDPASPQDWIGIQIEKILKHWTAKFIHVSASERAHGIKVGVSDERRSDVIVNGIDTEKFQFSENSRAEIRSQLGFTDEHFVIGCVARFDPCKNHEDLIWAIKVMHASRPNIKLVLIGSGETEEKIRRMAVENQIDNYILFLGEQKNIKPYYSAFDIFVLFSSHEGLPLTPLEALASKCPVILRNTRGNQDIISCDPTGLIMGANTRNSLCAHLERSMLQRSELKILAEAGPHIVQKWFSQSEMINAIQNFYTEICPLPKFQKVALIHDWLFHMRGGEKVLEAIGELFPLAPVYTLFLNRKNISSSLNQHQFYVSWLNLIPFVGQFYRYLLPLFPFSVKQFDTKLYDLLVSSNHCAAKGAEKGPYATHICYCHAPMRYAWGFESEYFGKFPIALRWLSQIILRWLRRWDFNSNSGVDYFISNSGNVKNRIKNFYNREAETIFPPIKKIQAESKTGQSDYFLIVSACVPYKRIDIAVQAFNELGFPLIIIGSGPLLESLKKQATKNIQFLGWQPDVEVAKYYAGCRALIFPTEEDFGMVPVEAMMHGKPVIAFGKGGALETVIPVQAKEPATGIFFFEQTAGSLKKAVNEFITTSFDYDAIHRHALTFDENKFKGKFLLFLELKIKGYA